MLINSIRFWLFFTAVVIPYFCFFKKSAKMQNVWLLLASYFFYGYAEIKMIPVILIATAIFYFLGIQIEKENHRNAIKASVLTTVGVVSGVGLLVYFKYLNFLIGEFATLFESMGLKTNIGTFKIVMPLGISYFTFKLISYVIEIHREKMEASHDPVAFATFVAFFPAIMAGPIDRPNEFLPQLVNNRKFNSEEAEEGLKRILWGMFQKMCIADNISYYVNAVYSNYTEYSSCILLASVFYLFQTYTDFCGYSNMAVGVSQIMGLRIRENFNRPLLAQNITELWRRWHMSLTTWITDYIFIPLNIKYRDFGVWGLYFATMINMIIVGAWHGANWTFVVFGIYHGFLMCIASFLEKPRKKFEKKYKLKKSVCWIYPRIIFTWILFIIGQMVFISDSFIDYLNMVSHINFTGNYAADGINRALMAMFMMAIVLFKEWKDENNYNIHFLHSKNRAIYLSTAIVILFAVYYCGVKTSKFIYFQF